MPDVEAVQSRIIRGALSRNASTYFVNGLPGSGISHFLSAMASRLPQEWARSAVFGPYEVTPQNVRQLPQLLLTDWESQAYIEQPIDDMADDMTTAWQALIGKTALRSPQTMFVLLDVSDSFDHDLAALALLFSDIRRLEGVPQSSALRPHHIIGGSWDDAALEQFYRDRGLSFPYDRPHNYSIWTGLTLSDLDSLVAAAGKRLSAPQKKLLFELTDGDPSAAEAVLGQISSAPTGIAELLNACRRAAGQGPEAERKQKYWSRLSADARSHVRQLVLSGRLRVPNRPAHQEPLIAAGVVRRLLAGPKVYVGFRSWFVELLVRQHLDELGIRDAETAALRIDELVPSVMALNAEAVSLIYEIENAARNFVVLYLRRKDAKTDSLLSGRGIKYSAGDTGAREREKLDAHERAMAWRERNQAGGLMTEHNPLIAYSATRELATIIREIGLELNSEQWKLIADSLDGLAPIRDAVMHSQLIDEDSLRLLSDLRYAVYEAIQQRIS